MNTYTVYNKKTDMPVCIGCTVKECAKAMGIKEGSFRTIYSLVKNGKRKTKKWEILSDDEFDEDV